jgi:hypothetical protein
MGKRSPLGIAHAEFGESRQLGASQQVEIGIEFGKQIQIATHLFQPRSNPPSPPNLITNHCVARVAVT